MKIKTCSSVAGVGPGQTVDVADEYGAWLLARGYAVRVEEKRTQKIDNEKNDDHESESSKESSRAEKRSSPKR